MESISLAMVEDDMVASENLKTYLDAHPSITVKLAEENIEGLLKKIKSPFQPDIDLLFLNIGLPGMAGLKDIQRIKQEMPDLDIAILTTYEESDIIVEALCAGACSYISKRTPLSQIRDAVFTIYRGGSYMSPSVTRKVVQHFRPKKRAQKEVLTPRQKEIVKELVAGLTYQKIANKLEISLDTVRDHIRRIYRQLNVNSKMEVVRKSMDGELW